MRVSDELQTATCLICKRESPVFHVILKNVIIAHFWKISASTLHSINRRNISAMRHHC